MCLNGTVRFDVLNIEEQDSIKLELYSAKLELYSGKLEPYSANLELYSESWNFSVESGALKFSLCMENSH